MRAAGDPQHCALMGCPPFARPAAPHHADTARRATCPLPPQKLKPSGHREVIRGFRSRDAFSTRGNRRPLKGDGAETQGGTAGSLLLREPARRVLHPSEPSPLPARPACARLFTGMDDNKSSFVSGFLGVEMLVLAGIREIPLESVNT